MKWNHLDDALCSGNDDDDIVVDHYQLTGNVFLFNWNTFFDFVNWCKSCSTSFFFWFCFIHLLCQAANQISHNLICGTIISFSGSIDAFVKNKQYFIAVWKKIIGKQGKKQFAHIKCTGFYLPLWVMCKYGSDIAIDATV